MIHVTVTTVSHLLRDDQMVQLGRFIQATVATALDVPDDESARVCDEDVSVEFGSFMYGINLPAIQIFILAPDHPRRVHDLAVRLSTIAAELRRCPHMPSRAITNQKGGVSVQIVLGPSAWMRI